MHTIAKGVRGYMAGFMQHHDGMQLVDPKATPTREDTTELVIGLCRKVDIGGDDALDCRDIPLVVEMPNRPNKMSVWNSHGPVYISTSPFADS